MRSTVDTKLQAAHHSATQNRKPNLFCGKIAVSSTDATAPITVPISRNTPLRSEAPSTGCATMAADVPAQLGLSSWRKKAR